MRELLLLICFLFYCVLGAQTTTGLATAIKLEPDGDTEVILADYFLNPFDIKKISASDEFTLHYKKGAATLKITYNPKDVSFLSCLKVKHKKRDFDILMKKWSSVIHTIVFDAKGVDYKDVLVAGSFNGWSTSKNPMQLKDGVWTVDLVLAPGSYQYKLVLDGNWVLDPANSTKMSNNLGDYNSCFDIEKGGQKQLPFIETDGVNGIDVSLKVKGEITKYYVLWQNQLVEAKYDDGQIDFEIPEEADWFERTHIRVFAYNQFGLSNDVLIPLQRRSVITVSDKLKRSDWHSMLMYFVLVDRFNNGNIKNDERVEHPELADRANYQGGDLAGVDQKLLSGYFKDLGFNTLWLSPISQNPKIAYKEWPEPKRYFSGYHGYWPISSSKIDYRFGTDREMHSLVHNAHASGINVLLDFVTNHVHEDHPMYKNKPSIATNLYLPDSSLNIRIWDDQRLTTWFDTFLPSLDFENESVRKAQVDSAYYWLDKFDLDGYRHDATKHIPISFWRNLSYKINRERVAAEGKPTFQIGETYGSHSLINSYIASGVLDCQFDFNLFFDARDVFLSSNGSFTRLKDLVETSLDIYGHHHLMGNISGNHDMPRFMSYASGAITFDEDPKEAGWQRNIEVVDEIGYKKQAAFLAFIMTIPGVPVLYYGDEIGMVGANDPDCRRMMLFDGLNEQQVFLKERVSQLAELRKSNMALMYGSWQCLFADKDVIVFKREYFGEKVTVALNKSTQGQSVIVGDKGEEVKAYFGSEFNDSENGIYLNLEPWSFDVIIH